MGYIFLSYSRKDSQFVEHLAEKLKQEGFDIWMDREGIVGGEDWGTEIVNAIDKADVYLVALSAQSVISPNVSKELRLAVEANKQIVPLDIESIPIPPQLRYWLVGLQRIDMTIDFDTGLAKVLRALDEFGMKPGAPAQKSRKRTGIASPKSSPKTKAASKKRPSAAVDTPVAGATPAPSSHAEPRAAVDPKPAPEPAFATALLTHISLRVGLRKEIEKALAGIIDKSCYLGDAIPAEKRDAAIASYAKDVSPSDVLLLYDVTTFGNAKNGLLLTTERVFWKNMIWPGSSLSYEEIETIRTEPNTKWYGPQILINENRFDLPVGDWNALANALANAIRAAKAYVEASSPQK